MTKKISYVDRTLSNPGLDRKTVTNDNFNRFNYINPYTHTYTVKKGYALPVTAYKMIPSRIGLAHGGDTGCPDLVPDQIYTQYKLDCILPENSTFICNDHLCKEIISNDTPIIKNETRIGKCYGDGCINKDWEILNSKIYSL